MLLKLWNAHWNVNKIKLVFSWFDSCRFDLPDLQMIDSFSLFTKWPYDLLYAYSKIASSKTHAPSKCNMQGKSYRKTLEKNGLLEIPTLQKSSRNPVSQPIPVNGKKKSCVHQLIQLVLYHNLSPVQWYNALLVSSQVVYSGFLNHPRFLSLNSFVAACCYRCSTSIAESCSPPVARETWLNQSHDLMAKWSM